MTEKELKNPKLYEYLKNYTQKAIRIIRENITENEVPIERRIKWFHQKGNDYVRDIEINKLWFLSIHKHKDKIQALTEYKDLKNLLDKSFVSIGRLDTMVGTSFSSNRIRKEDVIDFILYRLIIKKDRLIFDSRIFNTYYKQLENELYCDFIYQERITILQGFNSNKKKIVLTDGIEIIELKPEDIVDLLNRDIHLGRESLNYLHIIQLYAIKVNYKMDKLFGGQKSEKQINQFEKYSFEKIDLPIINLLKLMKTGKLIPLITLYRNNTISATSYSWKQLNQPNIVFKSTYFLDKKEVAKFKKLFNSVKNENVIERRFLNIALNRFGQAVERKSTEDKIIDFSICAEALFLNDLGNIQGELKYRLSLRASYFISNSAAERINIFRTMKDFYNIRSQIVHGTNNKIKLPKKEDDTYYKLEEFCQLIENYLRRALLKAIEIANTPNRSEFFVDWNKYVLQI